MARFRYVGDQERMLIGPPILVLSPGDTVEAPANPDPLLFRIIHTGGTEDTTAGGSA